MSMDRNHGRATEQAVFFQTRAWEPVRYNSAAPAKGTLRFVSPALKHIVFPALSRSGYLRYTAGAGPAVVTYHGVFPAGYEVRNPALDGNLVHADSLRRQLRLLKKRYHVITPEDFLHSSEGELSLPPRSILLTCDDALRNTLTEMVPILRELGLACLFFATGASADETASMLWYEELYLMLLDASEPITLSLPEAGVSIGPISPNEKHACWWNLVERLSQFDKELRRTFLDQIRDQLKLAGNWRERFVQNSTLAARFLTLDRSGLRQLAAAGMRSAPILSPTRFLREHPRTWLGGRSPRAGVFLRSSWGRPCGPLGILSGMPPPSQNEICDWRSKRASAVPS